MKYIKTFESKEKTIDRKLFNFFKEVSKPTRGLIIEKSVKFMCDYIFRYGEMELIQFSTLYNNYSDNEHWQIAFGDELKHMPQLKMIKEYILSEISAVRINGHIYEQKYKIVNDEKTKNAKLSKENYEIFINTSTYNI